MPREIDRITYQCTGSEANDLAIRIARNYTGGRGIIITNEAYHGNTEKEAGRTGRSVVQFPCGKERFQTAVRAAGHTVLGKLTQPTL